MRGECVDNDKRSVGGDLFLAFLEEEAVIPALVTRREAVSWVELGHVGSVLKSSLPVWDAIIPS